MPLTISQFPTVHFISPAGREPLELSSAAPAIGARSAALGALFQAGDRIGLIYRTGPELILTWLAALDARLVPTILQYPTARQSAAYWQASISNLVETCALAGLVAGEEIIPFGLGAAAPCHVLAPEPGPPAADVLTGSIIQMSSGTTGHRKAIAYSLEQIERHIDAYNLSLNLTAEDTIVSWLPLYHDMGFIACFVMPLLKGVPVVMIDPQDWVQQPELLFRAIGEHQGSVCYMPNFGFEVMGRTALDADLGSMRAWISCSEPVSLATTERFMAATGARPEQMSACYAMAENVFAVSQSRGLQVADIDGVRAVACGPPIDGVSLRFVDGEVWVKSETSLSAYFGGEPVTDADGYYATGDLGRMTEAGLVIQGRVRDVLIQAGVKHLLSDIDRAVEEIDREVRGRCCTVGVWDERQGTHRPVVLIEKQDFYRREAEADLAARLRETTALSDVDVRFAPPYFITKTSSGKVNRRDTLASWLAVAERRKGAPRRGIEEELAALLPGISRSRPVKEVVDSLGSLMIQMLLAEYRLPWNPEHSIDDLLAPAAAQRAEPVVESEVVSIVMCSDGKQFAWLTDDDLAEMAAIVGCPVQVEQVCAPAAPALMSDIVFRDWFLPGRETPDYDAFVGQIDKIKDASLLVFDDLAELECGAEFKPVLQHRFKRDPAADLMCVRWQRYTNRHDRLPITLVDLDGITPLGRERSLAALGEYLGTPLFRVSASSFCTAWTGTWEYGEDNPANDNRRGSPATPSALRAAFLAYLGRVGPSLRRLKAAGGSRRAKLDLDHFCCSTIDQKILDDAMDRFSSYCLVGPTQSLPYIRRRAEALGRPVQTITHWARNAGSETIALDNEETDCSFAIGAWGPFSSRKPLFQVMDAHGFPIEDGIPDQLAHLKPDYDAARNPFIGRPSADPDQTFFKAWTIPTLDERAGQTPELVRRPAPPAFDLALTVSEMPGAVNLADFQAFPQFEGSKVEHTERGVLVSTPAGVGSWAAQLPITGTRGRRATVALIAQASAGKVMVALNDQNGKAVAKAHIEVGPAQELHLDTDDLSEGHSLLFRNAHPYGEASAALVRAIAAFPKQSVPHTPEAPRGRGLLGSVFSAFSTEKR